MPDFLIITRAHEHLLNRFDGVGLLFQINDFIHNCETYKTATAQYQTLQASPYPIGAIIPDSLTKFSLVERSNA